MLSNRIILSFLSCTILSAFLLFVFLTSQVRTTYGADTVVASLVNTIDTSSWSPPSPDPAGITYNPFTNTLFVADSEVDEMPIFQGKNVYETTLTGTLVSTADTLAFSNEPTDIAFNPDNGHYFFSNDGKNRVYEVALGTDGTLGTGDDVVTFISASAFGNTDTEGVGYGDGKLFVSDGTGMRIYVVNPGVNGLFDGIAPTGDDQVTSFDVGAFGVNDPEGVAYNPDNGTLFVVDYKRTTKLVIEVTTQGELVKKIDISQAGSIHPGGITYAPASNDPSKKHLYIVDRAVDNNSDANENDGKIYEMSLPTSAPTNTPTPTADPTLPTATPTQIPTPTSGQSILTFSPTADATVNQNTPNKNFGSVTTVVINTAPQKNFLMKFTVSGVNGKPVTQAKLRLRTTDGSDFGGNFYRVANNSWAENTVTWNNAPAADPAVIASLGKVTAGSWYEVDLSSLITADGTYSIRVSSQSANGAGYASKEGTAELRPQLIVTTAQ